MEVPINSLRDFLIRAKKETYAAAGDNAIVTAQFKGSKQLEYEAEEYLYRDIYFGFSFFIGQEVVEYKTNPIWSMVYSGGVIDLDDRNEIRQVYNFLRKALRLIDDQHLFRGPRQYIEDNYAYKNEFEGEIENFRGKELIYRDEKLVYKLRYNGGMIR